MRDLRREWYEKRPAFPWLDAEDRAGVEALLRERGWLEPGETIERVEKAGEGNMNLTLRVVTDRHRVVLKQSRPWVEKYPFLEAPWDRAIVERRFYEMARGIDGLADYLPELLAYDDEARLLVLSDLGDAGDWTRAYGEAPFAPDALDAIAEFAARLHSAFGESHSPMPNREMRQLNHTHIYSLPTHPADVAAMGLDLDQLEPGLAHAAHRLAEDDTAVKVIRRTGERYLADGPRLVHGDFFPGSFIDTPDGPVVIDGEFSYFGDAEFDLGNLLAHLALANETIASAQRVLDRYREARGPVIDDRRLADYAACEVIRRLIGVAQLPLAQTQTTWRRDLLEAARRTLLKHHHPLLWEARS